MEEEKKEGFLTRNWFYLLLFLIFITIFTLLAIYPKPLKYIGFIEDINKSCDTTSEFCGSEEPIVIKLQQGETIKEYSCLEKK